MGFLHALLGRPNPVSPTLDALLVLPTAIDKLDAGFGFTPTGLASVCFRATEKPAFREIEYDVRDWLNRDNNAMPAEITEDSHGYTWMTIRRPPDRFQSLIEDLHAASFKFTDNGLGPSLLCAVTTFRDRGERNIAVV